MLKKLTLQDEERLRMLANRGIRLGELARQFGISVSTVERTRYTSLRILSRNVSRRRREEGVLCYKCGGEVENHDRCVTCGMLIHQDRVLGLVVEGKKITCAYWHCIDKYMRTKMMVPWENL